MTIRPQDLFVTERLKNLTVEIGLNLQSKPNKISTYFHTIASRIIGFTNVLKKEYVPSLMNRFLENVHTKNPILEPNELRKLSRRLGENVRPSNSHLRQSNPVFTGPLKFDSEVDCEMREEIALPPAELVKIEYSGTFPSLPCSIPDPDDEAQAGSTTNSIASSERSWYYYLSKIAGRRIVNRITAALYLLDPEEWTMMPVQNLLRIAEELDTQVIQESNADELSYFLHAGIWISVSESGDRFCIWQRNLALRIPTCQSTSSMPANV
ncbi:predicted protein [Aspergillus nidulans FGSC A4]|uniref:Uncharacterized protein n=1 Tax=Emericella nidulans (strain FGSC A4 / ATCC 38163 / CBS 112.46 / NRRL 194 / M139) TaxID=227321 RepID=Q5BHE5_EMENI|nr:hypothetical protein [Aspergillus nidulans FGSC A4]EAA65354.1 predicted protein [Aspergillus nidulans FGSC A4]CBF90333.1 TPA: conserved hypothetical protein [Aspergillus nidulans FGSC A4]|eukprot:XP_657639.1 predicted protein [Aspergillus nidulans FGSC A4]